MADDCLPGPGGSNVPRPFSQARAPQTCAPRAGPSGRVLAEAVLRTQKDTVSAIAEVAVELRDQNCPIGSLFSSQRTC